MTRRNGVLAALGALAAVGAAVLWLTWSARGGVPWPQSGPTSETSSPAPQAPEPTAPALPGGAEAPPRSSTVPVEHWQDLDYIWIGAAGRQFTDAEFAEIAADYSLVVIAGFHCGEDRACHDEAAHRLKALNPSLRVLAYHNMFLRRVDRSRTYGDESFEDAWYLLHEGTGERVVTPSGDAYFVDYSDPAYIDWVIAIMEQWMAEAPWDGVAIDRVYGLPDAGAWKDRLSSNRRQSLNEAQTTFLGSIKAALGQDKLVVYNGLKDKQSARAGRINDAPAVVADGVQNEFFCHHPDYGFDDRIDWGADVLNDVKIQDELAERGLIVLAKVSYADRNLTDQRKAEINDFCYASYLLAHHPGRTSYQFGLLFLDSQLDEVVAERGLPLGDPTGEMQATPSSVMWREFENGYVAVNFGETDATFVAPASVDETRNGQTVASHSTGSTVIIPARSARYFLRSP